MNPGGLRIRSSSVCRYFNGQVVIEVRTGGGCPRKGAGNHINVFEDHAIDTWIRSIVSLAAHS